MSSIVAWGQRASWTNSGSRPFSCSTLLTIIVLKLGESSLRGSCGLLLLLGSSSP
uniref:Uncharacterized protein n=1 Tax=Arundo donax TaxID=35708 RepID=A0A0A8ZNT2_ARUDO